MKTCTALKFYDDKRSKLAAAAGVSRQTIARWVKVGYVPIRNALRLQKKTHGELAIEPEAYK